MYLGMQVQVHAHMTYSEKEEEIQLCQLMQTTALSQNTVLTFSLQYITS